MPLHLAVATTPCVPQSIVPMYTRGEACTRRSGEYTLPMRLLYRPVGRGAGVAAGVPPGVVGALAPPGRAAGAGAGCTPVKTGVDAVTVIVPCFPPLLAVIVAVPAAFAVILPLASTLTRSGLSEDHAT